MYDAFRDSRCSFSVASASSQRSAFEGSVVVVESETSWEQPTAAQPAKDRPRLPRPHSPGLRLIPGRPPCSSNGRL